jgi:2-oxoglutarate dehydrogenase E1 component
MDKYSFLNAAHTAYFADLYDQYQKNPDLIEPSWRAFFQGYDFGSENYGLEGEIIEGVSAQIPEQLQKEFQVLNLIDGYRKRGHLFTKTNPVRARRTYTPTLEIENFGLSQSDLSTTFSAGEVLSLGSVTLQVIINHLERIYCDSIGVEYMYIRKPEEIQWIQDKLNVNDNHPKFSSDEKKYILKKLNEAVAFESFLHTK